MKEKIEKVTLEKHLYIADDGKEFLTKEGCLSYENDLTKSRAQDIVNRIPHFVYSPEWETSDYSWDWYFVSNQMELDAVRAVLYNYEAAAHEFEAPSFPCWLAFTSDCDGYGFVEGTLEQVLEKLNTFGLDIRKMALKIEEDAQ